MILKENKYFLKSTQFLEGFDGTMIRLTDDFRSAKLFSSFEAAVDFSERYKVHYFRVYRLIDLGVECLEYEIIPRKLIQKPLLRENETIHWG